MGIHGLTGFIDNNQHLLHHHQLHDCDVVLDGNNFYHFLYYACNVQCSFGGDYDVYRKKIITTFESFQTCGVRPYVVMDGAYTVDGRKLKTSLSRASARIRLVDTMANNQKGQALPALAYETFIQTLTEIGVPHATCQFEADNEIAVLANKLKCPVISNDSDFYIFDLSHGFLPLDYLDFRPLLKQNPDGSTAYTFLHCHKYHVDDFINSFDGLNRSVLPVFASLLGNDFIDVSAFSTFYARVKVPKVVSRKFSLPPRLSKVISVLHWLHSQHDSADFSVIKDEILGFIKPGRKEKVEKMFVSSVNGYVDVDNFQGFDLYQFFTNHPEKLMLAAAEDFCGYNGAVFPEWFLSAVCRGEITPSILNSVILHRVIILTQVEDLSLPTTYSCSLGLRQVLYGILLKDDPPKITGRNASDSLTSKPGDLPSKNAVCAASVSADGDKCKPVENTTNSAAAASNDVSVNDKYFSDGDSHLAESSQGSTEHFTATCEERTESDEVEVAAEGEEMEDEEDDAEVEIEEDKSMDVKFQSGQFSVKQTCIEEYTRNIKNLQKSLIEPRLKIGSLALPGLHQLSSASLQDRKSVLIGALEVDHSFIDYLSEDLQLFVSCLVLWVCQANPKVTLSHVETVIVGLILLRTLRSLKKRKDEQKDRSIDKTCLEKVEDSSVGSNSEVESGARCSAGSESEVESGARCSQDQSENEDVDNSNQRVLPVKDQGQINIDQVCEEKANIHHLEHLRENLDKYHKKSPTFNRKNHYDARINHVFAQLQASIVDAINLNKILRFPLKHPCPAELINGTFLYNFQTELQVRSNPELFLIAMLGKNSPLHVAFQRLKCLIVDYVGEECFLAPVNTAKKSRKRKSKGVKSAASVQSDAKNIDDAELVANTVPGFDIANKFSVLCVD